MGNAVFPTLIGRGWSVHKMPAWRTLVQEATSGKETRLALMSAPRWTFTLVHEYLPAADFQTLCNFFLARQGQYDSWLFTDPSDSSVTAHAFGTGDGSTTAFQLGRAFVSGGFLEPIQNLNGSPSIYLNGTLQSSGYTISSTGLVTFTAAPAIGAALTWTGAFYFRCRFQEDTADFEEFMWNLWANKELKFISVKQ